MYSREYENEVIIYEVQIKVNEYNVYLVVYVNLG